MIRFVQSKGMKWGFRLLEKIEARTARLDPGSTYNLYPTTSAAVPTDQLVKESTRNWIFNVVSKHKICPYAAESNYNIVICGADQTHQDRKSLIHEHVDKIQESDQRHASTLIVFPHLRNMAASRLYFEVLDDHRNTLGSAYDYEPISDVMKVQAVPFIPPEIFPHSRFKKLRMNLVAMAPWNTIQLLRYRDLQLVRGEDNVKGEKIRERNMQYLAKNFTEEEQLLLLLDCVQKAASGRESKKIQSYMGGIKDVGRDGALVSPTSLFNKTKKKPGKKSKKKKKRKR